MEKLLKGINKIKKDKKLDKPIAIKLSPDINENRNSKIIELINKYNIQGIVVSNSTDSNRENLLDNKKNEMGGLSGQPLKNISTNLLKNFIRRLKEKYKLLV